MFKHGNVEIWPIHAVNTYEKRSRRYGRQTFAQIWHDDTFVDMLLNDLPRDFLTNWQYYRIRREALADGWIKYREEIVL